jgi:gliding motility-associated-like protein
VPDTVKTRQNISICELRAPAVLTATTTLSYLWQDGSTARTYSAFSPGTYHVFRNDGCRHTWSDTFVVSFTTADTTISRSFDTSLCVDLRPMRITAVSGYSAYVWSNDTRSPSLSADTSGQYWVYQTLGCTIYIDSYQVYYIPRPPISLGSDRFLCVGDSVTLTQTHDALTTALWSTGDTGTSITTSTTGLYWLQLRNGCVVSDSVRLTFSPYPLVDLGPDTLSCLGLPIRLQSTPTYTSAFYTWSNGATTDNTSVGLSDNYWLRVTIMGCSTTDSIRVTIYYDTFTLYNSDVAICKGDRVQALLTANPSATFQWLPTAGIASATSASPLITPDTSDVYKVRISLGPCPIQEDSFFIDVQPNPQVYAGGNRFVCQFDTLQLKANVQPEWYTRYSYSWSPSTDLDNSTIYNPIYKGSSTTKYIVTVTTPAGCIGRDSLVVNLSPGNFAAIGRDTALCPYDSVVLSATGGATYRWIPSLYLSDSTSANPWFHGNTTQHYMVVVTKADGCNDTMAMKVTVYPNGVFALDESYTLYPGDTVQLNATTNCGRVSWFPVAGLSNPTISNPLAMPEVTTTYIVTGITQNGCVASDTTTVNVNPESIIEVPNAFRPGGGNNNKFFVIRRGDAALKSFRIFNRWGNLVFETNQIDEGWDGTWNGTPQPLGVYIYSVEAITNTGRPVKKQGNVTLLR